MWLFPTLLVYMAIMPVAFTVSTNSCLEKWSKDTRQLFSEPMDYMERLYNPDAGYLLDPSGATALRHNTRASVWYVVGLLARNQGKDAEQAMKIVRNVIDAQLPEFQWYTLIIDPSFEKAIDAAIRYGDYQQYPEEPTSWHCCISSRDI